MLSSNSKSNVFVNNTCLKFTNIKGSLFYDENPTHLNPTLYFSIHNCTRTTPRMPSQLELLSFYILIQSSPVPTVVHFLLVLFSFSRLNYITFGLRSLWFHATNVVLHAAACVLFTRVCTTIAGLRKNFAVFAGVLFAVHPIHTEAVSTLWQCMGFSFTRP